MNTFSKRLPQWAAVSLAAILVAGCQKSDVIAPDGATIAMTANPASIILSGGVQADPVTVVATVSNSIGVPLSGQDVRFTTTAGSLDPAAGSPVRTDSFGNATSVLTDARQPPTITAKSGKATQTLQLQTATCTLSAITLSPGPTVDLITCSDSFTFTATATDTNGDVCVGILINFATSGTSPSTDVSGTFTFASKTTDANGEASTDFTVSSTDCNSKCVGKSCTGGVKATSGTVSSSSVTFNDRVN